MNLFKYFSAQGETQPGWQSKAFKVVLWGIIGAIILLCVFNLGMFVGFKKARFSYQWGENYHRNFAGPRQGFFRDFGGKDFTESHGVFGQIIKIDPQAGSGQVAVVIKGDKDVEKIVMVKEKTVIERFKETIKPVDLKVNDRVVVIGEPNNSGQIEAQLIRVLPVPEGAPFNPGPPPMPRR